MNPRFEQMVLSRVSSFAIDWDVVMKTAQLANKEIDCCTLRRYTVESRFFETPREAKIGSKNRIVREIGGKITLFD